MNSIWSESLEGTRFPQLEGDLKTDVLIIGGGMAGVLCAYQLHQNGVKYALIEGGRIGGGITKNTTAKITAQHGLIYDKLITQFGVEKAQMYLTANLKAVEQFRTLCASIDCDFENKPSYVYTLTSPYKTEKEVTALARLGYTAGCTETLPLPLKLRGAVRFDHQAQFNPIKLLNVISKGLHIYEHTFAEKISGHTVKTQNGTITAKSIILATHFPMINLTGLYSIKLFQHRSYVIALENAPQIDGMYVDEAQDGLSFRNYDNLLLLGGGDHRTGKAGGNWHELRAFAKVHYVEATERYAWATQDCMSLDGVPYIGRLSSLSPDLYVVSGFNKWGMTSSMVSAQLLCDLIQGKENPYAPVFDPSRSIFHKQLGTNLVEAAGNLLSLGGKRCTHLGCKLNWNRHEKTWDCSCHGSRYASDGRVIDNPAKKDLHG